MVVPLTVNVNKYHITSKCMPVTTADTEKSGVSAAHAVVSLASVDTLSWPGCPWHMVWCAEAMRPYPPCILVDMGRSTYLCRSATLVQKMHEFGLEAHPTGNCRCIVDNIANRRAGAGLTNVLMTSTMMHAVLIKI